MIKNNKFLFNCPGKDCSNIFKINDVEFIENLKVKKVCRSHKCSCGMYFCITCKEEAHMPLRCDLFTKFSAFTKDKGQKQTEMWLKTFAKQCPKC